MIAIEILSPGDRREQVEEKLDDYFAFGIENIWIFDTERRTVQIATPAALQLVKNDELTVPGTAIRVVPASYSLSWTKGALAFQRNADM